MTIIVSKQLKIHLKLDDHMRKILPLTCLLLSPLVTAQVTQPWKDVAQKPTSKIALELLNAHATKARLVSVDTTDLMQLSSESSFDIMLPMPDGSLAQFRLTKTNVFPKELQLKYPQIATFKGIDVNNSSSFGRFEITPAGLTGMFRYQDKTAFIDPKYRSSSNLHISYYKENAVALSSFSEREVNVRESHDDIHTQLEKRQQKRQPKSIQRVYRLAVSAAAEYTQFHGGTKAAGLQAITTMVNRLNQVYEVDMGITFELVPNNDLLIYTDPNSDPFNNDDGDGEFNTSIIDDAIGNSNYDIGHVVGTGGGGLAGLGVVCRVASKGDGVTGSPSPTNDSFIIDYVAHEIGHQFGADHTFNSAVTDCVDQRAPSVAMEPGSASTIMSYAGICFPEDLQNNSDDYFHAASLEQMNDYLATSAGSSCGTITNSTNEAPTVDAGSDYQVPANTPLMLTAIGNDDDSTDTLTYTWEQYDAGTGADDGTTGPETMIDNGSRPIFRSYKPTQSPSRILPKMSDILAGTSTLGESYATTTRELNFRVTVRDGSGGQAFDDMKAFVSSSAGPFVVTAPNTGELWTGADLKTVSWDVANTQNAPVSCSNVDIYLSTDGGQNFDQMLATTSNDGSHQIATPNATTTNARIKVQCSNNIFFNVSEGNFSITYQNQAPEITGQQALSINEDTSIALALSDLIYTDPDNTASELILTATNGDNYTVDGLTVTPVANFNGALTVDVNLNDGNNTSNSFTLTITVNPVNDAPQASDDSTTVAQDSAATTINVLSNDTDVDTDDVLTITAVSTAGSGAVSTDGTSISYTPSSGFNGQETLTYTITDTNNVTATANVQVTVTATPTTPTTPTTPPSSGDSSGGGAINWLMLVMFTLFIRKKPFTFTLSAGKKS